MAGIGQRCGEPFGRAVIMVLLAAQHHGRHGNLREFLLARIVDRLQQQPRGGAVDLHRLHEADGIERRIAVFDLAETVDRVDEELGALVPPGQPFEPHPGEHQPARS